jgi:anti-sigma factor RsiW
MLARANAHLKSLFNRLQRKPVPTPSTPSTPSNQLDCRSVVALVTDYLEEQLQPTIQAAFEEHLAGCVGCTNYVEQMRKTIAILRSLTEEPTFPETPEEFRALFRTWKQNPLSDPLP